MTISAGLTSTFARFIFTPEFTCVNSKICEKTKQMTKILGFYQELIFFNRPKDFKKIPNVMTYFRASTKEKNRPQIQLAYISFAKIYLNHAPTIISGNFVYCIFKSSK